MSWDCGDPECWCCGNPHICQYPSAPTSESDTWTCPDCGMRHVACRGRDLPNAPKSLREGPRGEQFGWLGSSKRGEETA